MTPDPAARSCNTIIESLGVYLPPREVSTNDVIRGCRKKLRFPLERMTGIKYRHVVGDAEFAIDLAKEAITRCLDSSRYKPGDVDVLISASIARVDGPEFLVTYEPSTSLQLKKHFGFDRAMVFDVRSACSGMLAAVNIVDALLKQGVVERGLVVSGEYITHLATTAQKEIESLLDPRLACLTLGDAGAAVMLEAAPQPRVGFDAIDLCTLGAYAPYCIAAPTEQAHGGAIMFTDALKLTDAAARHGSDHALRTLRQAGWSVDGFEHLIMHQTSRTALNSAMSAINRLLKRELCHDGNTIDNLERCGNTASTSIFVALGEAIRRGRIRSGDRVIFAVSGSGLTLGTALYTFDDLPDRMAANTKAPKALRTGSQAPKRGRVSTEEANRIRIESLGTAPRGLGDRRDSMALLRLAATECLDRSSYDRSDLGLLIYAGTYRSRFVTEPAIAALFAGDLGVNAMSADGKRTLAFDVFNGAVGVLNACWVAAEMIRAKKAATAMVVAAETENNAEAFPGELLGIDETGAALIIDEAPGPEGFGGFLFRSFTEHSDAFTSFLTNRDGRAYLRFARDHDLERLYVRAIVSAVEDLLRIEGVEISRIARIFPPQISSEFISELSRGMNLPRDAFVDAVQGGRDLFTSSLPFALRQARDHGLVRPGDVGLIVTAGSGIQVGCALYYF
jgi:3-oxoacyl-[acyl-carrier-protein] synthase III